MFICWVSYTTSPVMYKNINSLIITNLIIKSHILIPFFYYSGKCMFTYVLNTGSSKIFFLINVNQKPRHKQTTCTYLRFLVHCILGFPIFTMSRTCWMLFQKQVVCTKLISTFSLSNEGIIFMRFAQDRKI